MHVAPACLDTDVARVPEQKKGQQLAAFPSRRGLLGNSRDVTGSLDISLEQGGQSAHEELHKAALRAPQVGRTQPALARGGLHYGAGHPKFFSLFQPVVIY